MSRNLSLPNSPNVDLLSDIQEVNLSYLLLAQRILRDDPDVGQFRLGLDQDVVNILLGLTMSQAIALASSPSVICGFRLNDVSLLTTLANTQMRGPLQQARSTLMLAQQATEAGLA